MKLIEFTRQHGDTVYVNPRYISRVNKSIEPGCTDIWIGDGSFQNLVTVRGELEAVVAALGGELKDGGK